LQVHVYQYKTLTNQVVLQVVWIV